MAEKMATTATTTTSSSLAAAPAAWCLHLLPVRRFRSHRLLVFFKTRADVGERIPRADV